MLSYIYGDDLVDWEIVKMKGKICAICALGVSLCLVQQVQAQEAVKQQQMAKELYKYYKQISAADTAYEIITKSGIIEEVKGKTLDALGELGKDQSYIDSMKYIEEAFKEQLYKPDRSYKDYYENVKTKENYKSLEDFDQSNWNWLLLQEYVATNRLAYGSSIDEVLKKACKTLNQKTGKKYTKELEWAKQDLVEYLKHGYGAIIQKVYGKKIVNDDISNNNRRKLDGQSVTQEFLDQCNYVQEKYDSEKNRDEFLAMCPKPQKKTKAKKASDLTPEAAKLIAEKYKKILEDNREILYNKEPEGLDARYKSIKIKNSSIEQLSKQRQTLKDNLPDKIKERTEYEGCYVKALLEDLNNPDKYKQANMTEEEGKISIILGEIKNFKKDLQNDFLIPSITEQEFKNAGAYTGYKKEMEEVQQLLCKEGNYTLIATLDRELHDTVYEQDKDLMNKLQETKALYQKIKEIYGIDNKRWDGVEKNVIGAAKHKLDEEYSDYLTDIEKNTIIKFTEGQIDKIKQEQIQKYSNMIPNVKQYLKGGSVYPQIGIAWVESTLGMLPDVEREVEKYYMAIVKQCASALINTKYDVPVQKTYQRLKQSGSVDMITLKQQLKLVLNKEEEERVLKADQTEQREKKEGKKSKSQQKIEEEREKDIELIRKTLNAEQNNYNNQLTQYITQINKFQQYQKLWNLKLNKIFNLVVNWSLLGESEAREKGEAFVGQMTRIVTDDSSLWIYDAVQMATYKDAYDNNGYNPSKFNDWIEDCRKATMKIANNPEINIDNISDYTATLIYSCIMNCFPE